MTFGSPVLAALLTPALFVGGAAAMAAPILIHLLSRRRFKRIRWAAMDFLIDAERRNRRRIRMEDWILLALRCLAVFLLGLMLARPFVSPVGLAAAL
ncbi:MAG: BatA domain-containing protein, partial [Planctomycetes bacterium]|nr:BatA domain-containing protein [Planctomycetota bacterium]